MFDFSHLEVGNARTARFVFHHISIQGNTPFLIVRPATEANKPYYNQVLKRSGKGARAVAAGNVSARMIEENRTEDRDLYPRHIVVGWGHICEDGTEVEGSMPSDQGGVPFSTDGARDFIRALPAWIFDELRTFCGNPANFVGSEGAPLDAVTAAGN